MKRLPTFGIIIAWLTISDKQNQQCFNWSRAPGDVIWWRWIRNAYGVFKNQPSLEAWPQKAWSIYSWNSVYISLPESCMAKLLLPV